MSACLFCGEPERVEIFDYYPSGEFILDTCCEGMRDEASAYPAEDPKAAAAWLETLGHGGDPDFRPLHNLRRVIDDEGQLLLDHDLEIAQVAWSTAKAFVGDHHRHNRPPAGWKFGTAVRNGSQTIAVATVGRPVARKIDHTKVVEINRVCVRTDVARDLTWNACSLLYGWAAREAKKRGFEKIITYTREDEPGTSLIAAGYEIDGRVRAESWDRAKRQRDDHEEPIGKIRWARYLKPNRRRDHERSETRRANLQAAA